MRRPWTHKEKIRLLESYATEGIRSVATEFQRSSNSITGMARKFGLRSLHHSTHRARQRAERSNTVNPFFFDSVSPDVAFALGIIWSRGWLKTTNRHVLKIKMPADRNEVLYRFMSLLRSRHVVQRSHGQLVVEICNSRLISRLRENFGPLPSLKHFDPPLPVLPFPMYRHFVRGFFEAAGTSTANHISLRGRPGAVSGLAQLIRDATGAMSYSEHETNRTKLISWNHPDDLERLKFWLELSHLENQQ